MIRFVLAGLLILAGCSPTPEPKKPPDVVELVRRLIPEKKPEPVAVPVPTPKAKPKKVEKPKAKPRKAVRKPPVRATPKPRQPKGRPVSTHQRTPQEADLPYPCWMVRLHAKGKTDAELRKMGRDNNVKLTPKQERQARACLGRK